MTSDGIGGTDNVRALFNDRPTAAGIPPQQDVIDTIEAMLRDAKEGKITGLLFIAFDQNCSHMYDMAGKVPYSTAIGVLEQFKTHIVLKGLGDSLAPK